MSSRIVSDDGPASYRSLFEVREFRALFFADVLSVLGDQIAVVALSVLVYQRSGSALLTGFVYSLIFLPWFLGGPVLSALADRWPRKPILVTCCAAQFLLVGAAAIPATPLVLLLVLVTVAAFLVPTFEAARGALRAQLLDDERYVLSTSVSSVTHQGGQLLGFAAGGTLLTVMSPSTALGLDALTFLAAAVLLWLVLENRQVTRPRDAPPRPSVLRETLEGLRAVATHPEVRSLMTLVWLVSMYTVVPESLAVVYAAQLDLGAQAVGLLMAAAAAGVILGSIALTRLVGPSRRLRCMRPLALLGPVPLLVVAAEPDLAVSFVLFALVGALSACTLPAHAAVVQAVPDEMRGRVFGVASTGLAGAQLIVVLGAGAAAQHWAPTHVVAASGVIGIVAVGALLAWSERQGAGPPVSGAAVDTSLT